MTATQAKGAAIPDSNIAPRMLDTGIQLEGELQVRSSASSAVARLAIPAWKAIGRATLFEATVSKGEKSLGSASVGVIQRFRPAGGNWVFGLNAFYETLQTPEGFDVQQVTVGGEVALKRHIIRANAWFPVTGGETHRRKNGDRVSIAPTRGFDAEYEIELPTLFARLQPRVAAGYYYLRADDAGVFRTVSGFKARAELQYEWVSAGLEWREDGRAFGGHWLGFLRVSVPLGRAVKSDLATAASRMEAPIRRDVWPLIFRSTKAVSARPEEKTASIRPAIRPPSPPPGTQPPSPPVEDVECCDGAPDELIFD